MKRMTMRFGYVSIIIAVFLFKACTSATIESGVKKDIATGLTSAYQGMVPGKVMLVMNDEVLGHTDIPLGEKFAIVDDHISGLTNRNGKVSVGCSLLVTDTAGVALMDEKDLFADNDVYDVEKLTYLRCAVSTGAPMKWEETYSVTVTFWDKYGTGRIVNKVTIRTIDIP